MKGKTTSERVLEIVQQQGVMRPKDLDQFGIPRKYLNWLYHKGALLRVANGLYALPNAVMSQHQTMIEASKRVPQGVICLLSALLFHQLTTQDPVEVWIAIGQKSRKPKEEILPLRVVRFSGLALQEGITEHRIQGADLRVYNAAKTVADCFKFRNKIGLDVAVEALRDCLRDRKCSIDELWYFARVCRVANIMKPYMEAIVSD